MFAAIVTFFGADKGGRHTPPKSGFRPQMDVHGAHTSCVVESAHGEEEFLFDREFHVSLRLMFPELYQDAIQIGDRVEFYEGNKIIGIGEIIR